MKKSLAKAFLTPEDEQREEVISLALKYLCGGDMAQSVLWYETSSPIIGDYSPSDLVESGYGKELIAVMKQELIKVDA